MSKVAELDSGHKAGRRKKESGWDLLETRVLDTDMCCGCGGCVGICPVDALHIAPDKSFLPVVDPATCIHCPLCYEVCPGKGYPMMEMAGKINDAQNDPPCEMDPVRGPELGHVLGWSTNATLRTEGASGGLTTSLVLHCIETGVADEALVTVLRDNVAVPMLTSDPTIIMEARGSKYSPVPIMDIIDDVRRNPRKIIIVGTGCHLASWELAALRFKRLQDCVVLSVGFFCGGVQSVDAVEAVANSLDVKYPEEVEFLGFREGDFPGNARFKNRESGEIYDKHLYPALDIVVPYYTLNRCNLCPDNSAWLADLVVGDHHMSPDNDTAVTIRTTRGRNLLESAKRMGRIEYHDMTPRDIKRSTSTTILNTRVYPAVSRIGSLQKRGKTIPVFDLPHDDMFAQRPQYRILSYFWIMKYHMIQFAASGWRLRLVRRFPFIMQHLGHFLYYFPNTIPGFLPLIKFRHWLLSKKASGAATP